MEILLGALAVAVLYTFSSLRILKQYERGVTFLLGKFWATKGPGLVFVPSIGGRSHCPEERTLKADCVNGANILLRCVLELSMMS